MVVEKTCMVSKEADELASALVSMVEAIKGALSDGWQPGADIPTIIAQAVTVLGPAVDGLDKLDDEKEEDLAAFMRAFGIAGVDIAAMFMKKEEVVAEPEPAE